MVTPVLILYLTSRRHSVDPGVVLRKTMIIPYLGLGYALGLYK